MLLSTYFTTFWGAYATDLFSDALPVAYISLSIRDRASRFSVTLSYWCPLFNSVPLVRLGVGVVLC